MIASSTTAATAPLPGAAGAAHRAPPARLPGSHFAAGLLFLLLGAMGLVAVSPELAAGVYMTPRVAAVTHLFTLGWITTSIFGALYQFLPVALEEPIRWIRVAYATLVLHVPGLLLFVLGLATSRTSVMLVGAATFGTGMLLFLCNLAAMLKRARRRDVTWWSVALAGVFLAVTLVFGLALGGNLRWGYLGTGRLSAMGVHLHVAIAGWVLLVMIGVGYRLLPMFLLSHGASTHCARAAVALVATGAGVLAVLHHAPTLVSYWVPAVLITAGTASFLVQARLWFGTRHRRKLDSGMRLAAAALVLLTISALLGWGVLLGAGGQRLATAYVAGVLLSISLFVAAHYTKIVPFLVWYHRFGPLAGKQRVPKVAELYSASMANAAGGLLVCGSVAVVAGVLAGATAVVRGGTLLVLCGAMLLAVQVTDCARRKP